MAGREHSTKFGLRKAFSWGLFRAFFVSGRFRAFEAQVINLKRKHPMEKELKGKWRLTFVKRFNGKTWETISRYHKGMTIKFHTQYPQINGERYQMQLIPDDYLILSNSSDTIRIEFKRV